MVYVNEIKNGRPKKYKTGLQEKAGQTRSHLQILYERVDTDEIIAVEARF